MNDEETFLIPDEDLTGSPSSEAATEAEDSASDAPDGAESSDEGTDCNSEADSQSGKKPKKKRTALKAILIAAAIPVLFAGGLAARVLIPFRAELGQKLSFRAPSFLISADTSPVDSMTLGEYSVPAKVLGFIDADIKFRVVDTTLPVVTLRQVTVMTGQASIAPEDFIESCEDLTEVSFAFASQPVLDSPGDRKITVLSTDESGNTTRLEADYRITDSLSGLSFELGTPEEKILSDIAALIPRAESTDISGLDSKACGEYSLRCETDRMTILTVKIRDTIAPKGEANDLDLIAGTRFIDDQIASLAKNVEDESEVFYSYSSGEPDWDRIGEQKVGLLLTDSSGNSTELSCRLMIHDIPKSLTVEAGTTRSELESELFKKCPDDHPSIDSGFDLNLLTLGKHELKLNGSYSDMTVEIILEDTIAPVITLRDLTTDRGVLPSPGSFVVSCTDATTVGYSYETDPDVDTVGTARITILAKDAGGNVSRADAYLTVIEDTQPPVIYGVKNIYAYEGDTISYRSGVYAEDAVDGRVTVYVDSSNVKTSTAGTYTVTYRASDSNGNAASATAYVYIRRVTQATLDELADGILSQIITSGMTERQKARAIYDWCQENLKYSTVTSYLMGNYYKAAYSGYKLHYGNCYTYYAVARSLLTRAGIRNQMIQRNNPNKPHYWNLVNIDGSWYHFDTCPQPYPNNDGCFLLTDAEVAAYSANKQSGYYNFNKANYPATP